MLVFLNRGRTQLARNGTTDIALRWSAGLGASVFYRHCAPLERETEPIMPELISSPPFLIIVAIFAILLVIGIAKRAGCLLIWIAVIAVILICFGIVKHPDLLNWLENLIKTQKPY